MFYEKSKKLFSCQICFVFIMFALFVLIQDYSHKLICVTPGERFEIPIRAIGPRAILDFRDEINLPSCLVKASTEQTHFVCNVGNCMAKFKLHTQRFEPVQHSIISSKIFIRYFQLYFSYTADANPAVLNIKRAFCLANFLELNCSMCRNHTVDYSSDSGLLCQSFILQFYCVC